MEETTPKPSGFVSAIKDFRRDDGFVSRYANNVQVESNAFDLKLTFGVLDQRASISEPNAKPSVDQHTSINISWPEVKLLIFYMQLHVAGYEKENGKIRVPARALPTEIPEVAPSAFDNPEGRRALDLIRKMREEFIAELNEP